MSQGAKHTIWTIVLVWLITAPMLGAWLFARGAA